MVYLHTAAAWVQAVPQQPRMHAAVVAGPASTGSGVRPRVRRRRSRRQWDWRTADNIVMARGVCNIWLYYSAFKAWNNGKEVPR